MATFFDLRSQPATAVIKWLRALADALDQTGLYFDKKPILASATAVDAFVYTKPPGTVGAGEKKRWRDVIVAPSLRLGVLGAAGSGKSFLTRESAATLARESARLIEEREFPLNDVPVPFWATAEALAAAEISDAAEMIVDASLRSITRLRNLMPSPPSDWLLRTAASTRALIVVDALDELAGRKQIAAFKLRCHRLKDLPGRLITTCRTMHWEERAAWLGWTGLVDVEFAPFGPSEQLEFSRRFFSALPGCQHRIVDMEFPTFDSSEHRELWRRFFSAHHQYGLILGAEALNQLLAENHALRQACGSPLLLAFICILQAQGKDLGGANMFTVYVDIIRLLLSGEWRNVTPKWAGEDYLQEEVLHFLESAAWLSFSEAPEANRVTLSQWKRTGTPPIKSILPELEKCGILSLGDRSAFNDRSWTFLHRTLLVFLAARSLARKRDATWIAETKKHFWHEPDWIEFFVFLAAQVKDATPLLHAAIESFLSPRSTAVRVRIGQAMLALHHVQPDSVRRSWHLYLAGKDDAQFMDEASLRDPAIFRDIVGRIEAGLRRERIEFETFRGSQAFSALDLDVGRLGGRDSKGDVCGLKVIVHSVRDCYATLGVIHQEFSPTPGSIRDFIAIPKPSLVQALYTSIGEQSGCLVHVIIMTNEMESHARRVENAEFHELLSRIDQVQEARHLPMVPVAELATKNSVVVYTPGDEVVVIDEGATVLDLAYKIHSELGRTCTGAIANGVRVAPSYRLRHDDRVRVLKDSTAHPDERWIEWAHLESTRTKIAKYLRKHRIAATGGVSAKVDLT